VFLENRHHAVGKKTGQTYHVEPFNCTLRQRISRLVRKTLSLSKKLKNLIGTLGILFISIMPIFYNL
jgi:insertion element IS1 protein InsB